MSLPPCGLYRTSREMAGVPAGRLVYFHNHGNPGPGLYLPLRWSANRAEWNQSGSTLGPEDDPAWLEPLPAEGYYRVREAFTCCDKACVRFEPERLVQLGYDGAGEAIVFFPELTSSGLVVPDRGSVVERSRLGALTRLHVAETREATPRPAGGFVH